MSDLHNVNATVWLMGALQPHLPTPPAISKDWSLIDLDLKDCFYTDQSI